MVSLTVSSILYLHASPWVSICAGCPRNWKPCTGKESDGRGMDSARDCACTYIIKYVSEYLAILKTHWNLHSARSVQLCRLGRIIAMQLWWRSHVLIRMCAINVINVECNYCRPRNALYEISSLAWCRHRTSDERWGSWKVSPGEA
jgi:hypothetical protein